MPRRSTFLFAILAALVSAPSIAVSPVAAQDSGVLRGDSMPVADTIPDEAPIPRGAFIRAMIVPGWGHLYIDEPRRALIYGTLQTTSLAMLVKSLADLGDARDHYDPLDRLARDSLAAAMAEDTVLARQLSDPERFDEARLTYPGLDQARKLVRAREEHRQDWIVYSLFFTFMAGVDAYVTGHLKDFPADLSVVPLRDGGVRLGMRIPMPGR